MRQTTTASSVLSNPRFAWLDKLSEPTQQVASKVLDANKVGRQVKNVLNGVPWRHRVHPAIIIWPLGAWTTAAFLDILDALSSDPSRDGYRKASDASVAFGIAGALPTAAAGIADWVDLSDHQRRVGMAHALSNSTALTLYLASLGLRLSGKRGWAWATGYLGFGVVMLGGVLGGELVYNLGINVTHQLYPKAPVRWVDVLGSGELPEGKPVVVEVERVPVMLLRRGEQVYAVEEWCTHVGGPLAKGKIEGEYVECPWHGSRFCLADGRPVQGPAASPLRTFEVRERDGRIEVHPSYEAESWPPPPAPPSQTPVGSQA